MSHHGLQVLYTLMNLRDDWVCERSFTPGSIWRPSFAATTCRSIAWKRSRPLSNFDVLGFTLQYELSFSNVLTMLDLGGIALHSTDRTLSEPLVIAGGPCAQNPEPLAPFIDVFVTGDGEPSLPVICDTWWELKRAAGPILTGEAGRQQREELLAELALRIPFAYVPRFYEPEYSGDGRFVALHPTRPGIPATIEPAVIDDLEAIPLPTRPIVPYVECVHDRIAIEIMRGCPWQCRFCQSTVIKRPMRIRSVETIVQAALESYRATGFQEVSLLSLSTSDYPYFEQLLRRLHEVFVPLGVTISLPSLRVNEQLKTVAELMSGDRRSMTLAPEVARDDMREQIRKKIKNQDLVRRLPRGVPPRLAASEALFPVRAAGRAYGRLGRDRRHGRDDRPRSAAKSGANTPRSRPAYRTSCPRRIRPTSGTACKRVSISTRPIGTCGGGVRSSQ